MTSLRSIFLLMIAFFLTGSLCGQIDTTTYPQDTQLKIDETATVKLHDPKKAALLSLIPGGGQIYNKKWWKLPIIYAGLGVAGYFAITNGKEAIQCRNEFFFRQYGAKEYYNPKFGQYGEISQIQAIKNNYLRNMEISIGVFSILYALNIVDAMVDAHLFYFDVSDDLSFQIIPYMDHNNPPFRTFSVGIAFNFSIK